VASNSLIGSKIPRQLRFSFSPDQISGLIEHLGLTTLIITDVDTGEAAGHHKSTPPKRGCSLVTNNATLKKWHPEKYSYDDLLKLSDDRKVKTYPIPHFSIRVAYQGPTMIRPDSAAGSIEALPATFEDALAFENLDLFKTIDGGELVGAIKTILADNADIATLADRISIAVRKYDKAEFALDLLLIKDIASVKMPRYVDDGLKWLETQLDQVQQQVLRPGKIAGTVASTPVPAAGAPPKVV
jgi:hypothetical protein